MSTRGPTMSLPTLTTSIATRNCIHRIERPICITPLATACARQAMAKAMTAFSRSPEAMRKTDETMQAVSDGMVVDQETKALVTEKQRRR